MNYTKAQQEIVSWIMADTARGVCYYEEKDNLVTLCHPDGSHAYTIPHSFLAVNLAKCTNLPKPLVVDDREEAHLLEPTGNLVEKDKRILMEHKNQQGTPIYFNKRLLEKYGKGVKLYQPKPFYPAVVVDTELNVMVGVLCPVRHKTENQ